VHSPLFNIEVWIYSFSRETGKQEERDEGNVEVRMRDESCGHGGLAEMAETKTLELRDDYSIAQKIYDLTPKKRSRSIV
jgi:hypothetical protein